VAAVVRNQVTGMCADATGTGSVADSTLAQQDYCASGKSDNQMYQPVSLSNGNFVLRNVKSGLCLDVDGREAVDPGTVLYLRYCLVGSDDNQMFRKRQRSNGFQLVNLKSKLCLDVQGTQGNQNLPGQSLILSTCSTGANTIWTFG